MRRRTCEQNTVNASRVNAQRHKYRSTTVGEDREDELQAFSTTPRCINGPVVMPAEADEAEESEEPREMAQGKVDGNITRGIELDRLG